MQQINESLFVIVAEESDIVPAKRAGNGICGDILVATLAFLLQRFGIDTLHNNLLHHHHDYATTFGLCIF